MAWKHFYATYCDKRTDVAKDSEIVFPMEFYPKYFG